ncbi:MAG: aspartate kinase [Gemmatimonadota bacterium]
MIVCKFGGTSVGDAAAIRRLVEIVRSRLAERPVVVVSALSGTTNRLLAAAGTACEGTSRAALAIVDEVIARHHAMAHELGLPVSSLAALVADREAARLQLERAPDDPAALRDTTAAWGELWSSRLVTAALDHGGIRAEWVDVRPVLETDDRFGRATPDTTLLRARAPAVFGPLVEAGTVPVTQGFIGSTRDGRVTTLGRGGSDFTASLLGAALVVERVEIWTDVDGLMTADPRVVPNARTLPQATYDEAAELATFGAKVIHPFTQLPLAAAGIPFAILNSFAPERSGTLVKRDGSQNPQTGWPVRSIAWKPGIAVLNIRTPRRVGSFGFLRAVFEVFERHEVAVDVLATSEVNLSLTIEDVSRLAAVVTDLLPLGEVTVYEDRAVVAVVGVGLRGTKGFVSRLFTAIRDVNMEVISQGASEINVTFVVKAEDGPDAVRRLHREFFGGS